MTNLKKFLVVTAAAGAVLGLAAPAHAVVTGAAATTYIASTTPPAGALNTFATFTMDDAGAAAYGNALASGVQLTFTLSNGTYATLPTLSPVPGLTFSFVSGGIGSSAVTYQVTGSNGPGADSFTITGLSVSGVTANTDGGFIRLSVSDNAGALAGESVTAKRATLATFANAVSLGTFVPGTLPLIDLDSVAPAGSVFVAGGNLGTVPVAFLGGLLNYAVVPVPVTALATTSVWTIPFAAGTLASATLSGCAATVFVTPGPPTLGTTLTQATGGSVPACSYTATLVAPGGTPGLIAAGPTSAAITVPMTGAPPGALSTITQAFNPINYSSGHITFLNYVVGSDTGYQYYIFVNNTGAASFPIGVSSGGFSTTVGSSLAGGASRLVSIVDIRAALLASGAPASMFVDSTARGRLTVVTGNSSTVTPLLRSSATGDVQEIGTDFGSECYHQDTATAC